MYKKGKKHRQNINSQLLTCRPLVETLVGADGAVAVLMIAKSWIWSAVFVIIYLTPPYAYSKMLNELLILIKITT